MSEIYPSVRTSIRNSVLQALYERPGAWLSTHDLLGLVEEAETSGILARILSDMAATGRLAKGPKTQNANGQACNTWGLSPEWRGRLAVENTWQDHTGQAAASPPTAKPQTTVPEKWHSLGPHLPPFESIEQKPESPMGGEYPDKLPMATDHPDEPPPLPVEGREDEAQASVPGMPKAPEAPMAPAPADAISDKQALQPLLDWFLAMPDAPPLTQKTTSQASGICDFAALDRPIDWTDELDALPPQFCKAHGLPPGFTLAEPDQPLKTPPANQSVATDIHFHPLPERWLPDLRLRLLGADGRDDPEIILRINTEGHGAYLTLSTHGKIAFDPGELDFLPCIGTALCQFVDALYPYGTTRPTAAATTPRAPDQP